MKLFNPNLLIINNSIYKFSYLAERIDIGTIKKVKTFDQYEIYTIEK